MKPAKLVLIYILLYIQISCEEYNYILKYISFDLYNTELLIIYN